MDVIKIIRKVDFGLLVTVFLLLCFGVLMVYSATLSEAKEGASYLTRQLIWILLGVVVLVVAALFDYNWLKHYSFVFYLLSVILLLVVVFVGRWVLGAQRWIPIGPFQFQPSEFSKIFLILFLASYLSDKEGGLKNKDFIYIFTLMALPILLVFAQPDLGTSLVLIAILFGMIFAAGATPKQILTVFLIGLTLCFFVFHFKLLEEYQIRRFLAFLYPDLDPLGAGYSLTQAKIAVGSGGFLGKGLFRGTQTNLQFIPFHHTDFIFAVVGEELGFLGALILIGLFFALIMRGVRIATLSKNMFGSLIVVGIVFMWLFQIFVNIGMNIGLMPITGIPLPFISYGGSSMIVHLIAVGLLLSVYARRFI